MGSHVLLGTIDLDCFLLRGTSPRSQEEQQQKLSFDSLQPSLEKEARRRCVSMGRTVVVAPSYDRTANSNKRHHRQHGRFHK